LGTDHQFIDGCVLVDGGTGCPGLKIDPLVFFTLPCADRAFITGFQCDETSTLIDPVMWARPLIGDNKPVATPWRPVCLVEAGRDHDVADRVGQRGIDSDELPSFACLEPVGAVGVPGGTAPLVGPALRSGAKTLV
jgi:hypothetical protein